MTTAVVRAGTRRLELDGLRGVACLLVVGAHAAYGLPPADHGLGGLALTRGGGLVGVQVFFALSGFLITSLLLDDAEQFGRVRLVRFWQRRFRRLAPALLLVCLGCLTLALVVPAMRADAAGEVLLAGTYTMNLGAVAQHVPHGPWLGHTWSLAVEEQFYLVWPLVLIAAYKLRGRRGVAAVALVGVVLTVGVREVLEGADIYRSMRWDALLVGCWLAVARPRLERLAPLGVVVLAWYVIWMPDPLRPADFTVTAAAACLVVAGAHRWRWLQAGWLCYFGSISYGLYLWHVLLLRAFDVTPVVTVAASVLLAHLSLRFVENPLRSGPQEHGFQVRRHRAHGQRERRRAVLIAPQLEVVADGR